MSGCDRADDAIDPDHPFGVPMARVGETPSSYASPPNDFTRRMPLTTSCSTLVALAVVAAAAGDSRGADARSSGWSARVSSGAMTSDSNVSFTDMRDQDTIVVMICGSVLHRARHELGDEHLRLIGVGQDLGDDLAGLRPLEIAERQPLHVPEHSVAQVARDVLLERRAELAGEPDEHVLDGTMTTIATITALERTEAESSGRGTRPIDALLQLGEPACCPGSTSACRTAC